MKKVTKILAILVVLAAFVSLLPMSVSAQLGESVEGYDSYGYYVYYDFEEYGSSSDHAEYFKNDSSVNADGGLCDPFGSMNDNTAADGTGTLVADGDNHYYSFVAGGTSGDSSIAILRLTDKTPGDLIIGDAVEISFKFRMHEGLGTQQNIADTDKMSLIHLRRGGKGHGTQLYVDKYGNLYDRNGIVYTNTDQSKFLDISYRWYDASNTFSLYVNGKAVVEALPVRDDKTTEFRTYTTTTFDDDFTVSSIVQNNTTDRAIEICRASANNKLWGFDLDDVKLSRIETPQHGAYFYENNFDIASNGLSVKNTNGNVYVYGSSYTAGHGVENGNGYLTVSGNYFGIKDIYQLLSTGSFVTEFKIKGKPVHTSGLKPMLQFMIDGDANTNVNNLQALYVDKDGKIYFNNSTSTLINGFTLNENEWLDVTVVAVKYEENAGLFSQITDQTKDASGMTYVFSYFINGVYVGSGNPLTFLEWKNGRTASGYTYVVEKFTVDGTTVTALDTSALTEVDSTTTANHVIYKSVDSNGVPTYYDVETVDGEQKTYSVMTLTKSSYVDSLRFSSANFNLKVDKLKIYEGTCPEWFYESLVSDNGGDIWNISFANLGRTTSSNTAAMTNKNGQSVSGTVYNSGFFTTSYNQTAHGAKVFLPSGSYLDYYLPVPNDDSKFVGEYSFEIELKNITEATAKSGEWGIALFNQRFEDAAGTNKPTGSLMYVGDGTTVGDLTVYGMGHKALYKADGSAAKIDNTNGSKIRADVYVNLADSEFRVSYYLDGNPLYLEDGSVAYRVSNSTVTSRFTGYYGKIENYRTRLVHATGSCYVDIPSAKISMNERASYEKTTQVLEAGSVNAIEFTLPKLATGSANGAFCDVVKLAKGADANLSLLSVLSSTGELIAGSNGKYYSLCDADGNLLKLSGSTSSKITVVYDDINGDVRYYVNRAPAYLKVGDTPETAVDLAVFDTAFAAAEEKIEIQLFDGLPSGIIASAENIDIHKINANDSAEIIGFQENSVVNGVRIVAGVDSLYYENAGFEIEIYENGTLKKSDDVSNSTVFSSIVADDQEVTSEKYGYSYFTTVNIIDLPQSLPENSYILARSYTTVAGVKHYDTQVKINVTNSGYSIENGEQDDEITDDTEYFNKKQAVLLMGQSNMSGRGLSQYVEKISDERITTLYSDLGWVTMAEPIHKDAANGGIGLAASFAKAFVETYDCELGLVPLAKGGSSLGQWKKGFSGTDDTDLYENTVAMAKKAIEDGCEIRAILWHQGESNRSTSDYAEQFKEIMDGLIADIGLVEAEIVIVTGELCDRGDEVNWPIENVNAALNSDELKNYFTNYAVASSDGLTNDELEDSHFDAPSLRVLGYRYFEGFYEALMDKECTYEYSQDPLDYRIEPPVVEKENNSYYIADVDFNGYTDGATITGVTFTGDISVSTGVDKYAVMTRTIDTNPYISVAAAPTVGNDVVVEMDFRLSENFSFKSGSTSGALIKITPGSNSIVTVRLDSEGYILDNYSRARVGNALSPDEWTHVKVVCHMDSNTKDIYVSGTGYTDELLGVKIHDTYDTKTYTVTKIVIAQLEKIMDGVLEIDNIKVYENPRTIDEISDNIKLLGRAYELGTGIALDHAASGFGFNFNGSGNVVLNITADVAAKLAVTVDGTTVKNISVPQGTSDVLIAKELEAGDHSVEIVTETGISATMVVNKVAFTGKLLEKTADTDTYIEFIGDSITAGYGLSEAEGDHHDATLSYAYRTAKLLGSDYAIFAKSGMGIAYASGGVNIFENRYKYQSYVRNTTDLYAPERTPDLVVINLAQNDNWQWYDKGGNKQSDTYNDEDFDVKFGNMIDTVTGLYGKDVKILFVYGCMESSSFTPLATERSKYLIENVYTEAEGYNITYTTLTTDRGGLDNHPTSYGASVQADQLATYIYANYSEFKPAVLTELDSYIPSSWDAGIAQIPEEPEGFMFAVQTDTHFSVNSGIQAGNSIKALSNFVPLSFYVNLGDFVKGYYSGEEGKVENTPENTLYSLKELTSRYTRFTTTPVLVTFGNHDTNQLWCKYYGTADQQLTQDDHYGYVTSKLMKHNGSNMVTDGESNYYYMDFPADNMRVIMLNTTDGNYESTFDSVSTISDKQVEWFKNVALDTDMHVLVMTHIPLCENFPESSGDVPYNAAGVLAAVEEFIADGGSFIAYMYGHTHLQSNITDANGRLHISFANSATRAEVVIVNVSTKIISTIALGSNIVNRNFEY